MISTIKGLSCEVLEEGALSNGFVIPNSIKAKRQRTLACSMAHFYNNHGNHQLPDRDKNPDWADPRRE
jgi:hypothetical protein